VIENPVLESANICWNWEPGLYGNSSTSMQLMLVLNVIFCCSGI